MGLRPISFPRIQNARSRDENASSAAVFPYCSEICQKLLMLYVLFSGSRVFKNSGEQQMTARFFFPTYYIIDSKGICEIFMGTQKVAPWSRFRRAVRRGNEVFLSPFPHRHFMDRFRGLLVVAPDEKVAKFIAKKVNDATR